MMKELMDKFNNLTMAYKVGIFLFITFIVFLIYCLINRRDLINIQDSKEKKVLQESFLSSSPADFTMYYVNWCPHCKTAKPHFQNLMNSNNNQINGRVVNYRMVDCEEKPELGEAAGVESYPTFVLKLDDNVHKYEGERTNDGFTGYLSKMLS